MKCFCVSLLLSSVACGQSIISQPGGLASGSAGVLATGSLNGAPIIGSPQSDGAAEWNNQSNDVWINESAVVNFAGGVGQVRAEAVGTVSADLANNGRIQVYRTKRTLAKTTVPHNVMDSSSSSSASASGSVSEYWAISQAGDHLVECDVSVYIWATEIPVGSWGNSSSYEAYGTSWGLSVTLSGSQDYWVVSYYGIDFSGDPISGYFTTADDADPLRLDFTFSPWVEVWDGWTTQVQAAIDSPGSDAMNAEAISQGVQGDTEDHYEGGVITVDAGTIIQVP